MMIAEQIDELLRTVRGKVNEPSEEALLALADLSVSLLRMIDSRRERGIAFDDSYNEQELRRALISLADQKWPPGSPMTPARTSFLDETHAFQRFEHVMLNRMGDWTSRELKIVCRCGWSHISINRDPDDDVAVQAARDLLQEHVADVIAFKTHGGETFRKGTNQ